MPSPQPAAGDHYFTSSPGSASATKTVELALPEGALLRFATDRGTFSPDRIDAGTRVLLAEGPSTATTGTLVDLGCGYGPIAVSLARRARPDAEVWAIDVNERARALCEANAAANGVGGQVRVAAPDDVPEGLVVDQLWSNPPIRIGKAALHELLATWLDRLRPGTGTAVLVVQKHLGADSLARWLTERGHRTTRLASRQAYRVLLVEAAA